MPTQKNINCLIIDDETIAREVIATHLAKLPNIHIVASCESAMDAFTYLQTQVIDLIFLDINMPEISGISFAKSLQKNSNIIFTTAYRDYAVEGFELQAVDYLLKPISFDRLLKAVQTYVDRRPSPVRDDKPTLTESSQFMFVRADRRMLKVDFNKIQYIESYSDYVKIHLENKSVVTRQTISAIEAKLPQQDFLRIHRSFIVALNSITSFTHEEIVVNAKHALPMSRSYKKEVLDHLEKFE